MNEPIFPVAADDEDDPDLYFANAHDFVTGYLLPSWRHTRSGSKWCQYWWRHAEALNRLDALWRSFEGHRHGDASGMAVWWRDFADPTMSSLTRTSGTFAQCDPTTGDHVANPTWKSAPAPAGMFMDERKIRSRATAVIED